MRPQDSVNGLLVVNLPSHHPHSQNIGGHFHNTRQSVAQVHISTEAWSAKDYPVVDHRVYGPAR